MGCVSSKFFKQEHTIIHRNGGDYLNHVVSLTSSTYGVLKLDNEKLQQQKQPQPTKETLSDVDADTTTPTTTKAATTMTKKVQRSPPKEETEVINTWELMEDLEEGIPMSMSAKKNNTKSRISVHGFEEKKQRSPLKLLNSFGSPKNPKRLIGKENKGGMSPSNSNNPKQALKMNNTVSVETPNKAMLRMSYPVKSRSNPVFSSERKCFSPLFDPELVSFYEKELCEEHEDVKMVISPKPETLNPLQTLESFEKKCPPRGGENSVVIYTTTLRGIRKTFEDCNKVRSILESHEVRLFERDISMDSGLKEELRKLMDTKDVKVPIVFVKGRLIGGVDTIVKLEEEGRFDGLLDGIPRGVQRSCDGCGGIRFMMCMECDGSCKVLDEDGKKMVKCGECNENGLIQCLVCC